MAKTNLTVQLDEDLIRRARVVAAKRGTSVSALVARELAERAGERGGRGWTRDDMYAGRLDRRGGR